MSDIPVPEEHCVTRRTASDFKSVARPIWFPGCGDFGVLAAMERALALHGRPSHEVALISGIGCSSRLPADTNCYGFHGVHGRALAFATGLKVAQRTSRSSRSRRRLLSVGIISFTPVDATSICCTS